MKFKTNQSDRSHNALKTVSAFALIFATSQLSQAALFTYDVATDIGASGTLLTANQDNWVGDDIPNWRAQDQSGTVYFRNNNDGDDTITRDNDGNFGFTIDASTTVLTLTMTARIDTFWQAGIKNSSNDKIIGIGGDFGNSNDFFAYTGYQRVSTDNNLASTGAVGGNIATLSLVFDLTSNSYDLIYDPNGAGTILQDDVDYSANLSTADILGMNQLYTRTTSRFAGAATWNIETTVPEPSSSLLAALGTLTLVIRRRR